ARLQSSETKLKSFLSVYDASKPEIDRVLARAKTIKASIKGGRSLSTLRGRLLGSFSRNLRPGPGPASKWRLADSAENPSTSQQTSFSSAEASRLKTRLGSWADTLTGSLLVSTHTIL